jgi:selenophosphate synthase
MNVPTRSPCPMPSFVRAPASRLARAATSADDRELLASLACDAQTSGGLLLCTPAPQADACVAQLRALGLAAARIGSLSAPSNGARITLVG